MDADELFGKLTKQEKLVLKRIACQNQTDEQVAAILGGAAIGENLAALIAREESHDPNDKRNRWDLAKFARSRIPVLLDEERTAKPK